MRSKALDAASRQETAMKKQRGRVNSGAFEVIRTFTNSATEGEVAALQESFKRQADFLRRHGDDGRAAFWDALADGIARAAGLSAR
jgi:hypothetical protein